MLISGPVRMHAYQRNIIRSHPWKGRLFILDPQLLGGRYIISGIRTAARVNAYFEVLGVPGQRQRRHKINAQHGGRWHTFAFKIVLG